jgi:hypothetical protein
MGPTRIQSFIDGSLAGFFSGGITGGLAGGILGTIVGTMNQAFIGGPLYEYCAPELSMWSGLVCAVLGALLGSVAGGVSSVTRRFKPGFATGMLCLAVLALVDVIVFGSADAMSRQATAIWFGGTLLGVVTASWFGKIM